MSKGIEFRSSTVPSFKVFVVPNGDAPCELQVNNERYSVRSVNGRWSVSVETPSIVSLGSKPARIASLFDECELTDREDAHAATDELTSCIVCGDYYYCITGACAYTPCGWICG